MKVPVTVYAEMTPNPSTMKFVANKHLMGMGDSVEFQSMGSAKGYSPFAEELFLLPFVKGIFIASNFVTITKTDNADKSTTISMSAKDSTGKEIIHQYTLKPNTYLVDFVIKLKKADELITGNNISVEWQTESPRIEKDIS